jgi:hypothetical protein
MASPSKFEIMPPSGPDSLDVRRGLDIILKAAREACAEDLPDLIGKLESIKAVAWARLAAPVSAPQVHDELIDVTEASRRLGISETFLYSHHSQYPFTRRQGRKLLFSATGIDRYIQQNRT